MEISCDGLWSGHVMGLPGHVMGLASWSDVVWSCDVWFTIWLARIGLMRSCDGVKPVIGIGLMWSCDGMRCGHVMDLTLLSQWCFVQQYTFGLTIIHVLIIIMTLHKLLIIIMTLHTINNHDIAQVINIIMTLHALEK